MRRAEATAVTHVSTGDLASAASPLNHEGGHQHCAVASQQSSQLLWHSSLWKPTVHPRCAGCRSESCSSRPLGDTVEQSHFSFSRLQLNSALHSLFSNFLNKKRDLLLNYFSQFSYFSLNGLAGLKKNTRKDNLLKIN